MRTSFLPLAFLVPLLLEAAPLRVKVITSDRIETRIYSMCDDGSGRLNHQLVGTDIREGFASWTASGGVPPYTVVHFDDSGVGFVTIRIRDQEGNEATDVGYIALNQMERRVPCNTEPVIQAEEKQPTQIVEEGETDRKAQAKERLDVPRPERGRSTQPRERIERPVGDGLRQERTPPPPPRPRPEPVGRPTHGSGTVAPVQRPH